MGNCGREIQDEIRRVFWDEWDPIGVRDIADVPSFVDLTDEYDSYIGRVYHLLANDASADEIVDYLWWVERLMGLSTTRDRLYRTALRLQKIDVHL